MVGGRRAGVSDADGLRKEGSGALGGTRTHGLSLRRAALYPTELQALEMGLLTVCGIGLVPKEGFEPTHP